MPAIPDFDLYEALEVSKDASAQDITASYRRLARVHHPDKNLNNVNATAKFQKVQAAYEILSDERQRRDYDQPVLSNLSSGSRQQYHPQENYEDEYDEMEEMMFDQFFRMFFTRASSRPSYDRSAEFEAEMERMEREDRLRRDAEAAWEADRAAARLERARRNAAEKAKRDAKAELKKTVEDAAATLKEKTKMEYKLKMEIKFSANGCVTDAEKQACCEHCFFWPKEQMKKKFKCLTCGQKRGMTQYKCPYCALVLCQLCLSAKRFTKKI
ncbi:uncharacterized protein EAF01_010220 [Botrytis porri]|uniref:J domain-containing protein n=1 Tax=Botrytis porri TaxID=87229 RepID=A0A4Z1KM04_9HELO|nr:uncharacterized protein EAF01_010220 [Botrytis porri]KAF7894770.1 hypothetical protein EAF01_010220 [Botrytis porri]TGO85322.1 hypothetical protein BPOR_0408g00010 [Botrytis porri]